MYTRKLHIFNDVSGQELYCRFFNDIKYSMLSKVSSVCFWGDCIWVLYSPLIAAVPDMKQNILLAKSISLARSNFGVSFKEVVDDPIKTSLE